MSGFHQRGSFKTRWVAGVEAQRSPRMLRMLGAPVGRSQPPLVEQSLENCLMDASKDNGVRLFNGNGIGLIHGGCGRLFREQ